MQHFVQQYMCQLQSTYSSYLQVTYEDILLKNNIYIKIDAVYLVPVSTFELLLLLTVFTLQIHTHTHTTVLLLVWNMSGSTRVSRYQIGKTKKVKTNLDSCLLYTSDAADE